MSPTTANVGADAEIARKIAQVLLDNGFSATLHLRQTSETFVDILGPEYWSLETNADRRMVMLAAELVTGNPDYPSP
jgi:hypothetical protein